MTLIRIAVDGYASTGKSTLAKRIAASLGFLYIDTGAMYRMVALYAIRQGWAAPDAINARAINASLDQVNLAFARDARGRNRAILNGEDVEEAIRTMEVSRVVSSVSSLVPVRRRLVAQQQAMGHSQSLVMDGRDIGTVVFPDAELKLFVTADADVRATRRFAEMESANPGAVSLAEVKANLLQRDQEDRERLDSPLLQAQDAVVLDNSSVSPDELFEQAMRLVPRS
ncbi:MAG: (d)CMP kinase [Cryomorphaceae bacterium]|nr:(d)CMP kinase [Cryomorphaceae bacterium]